MMALLVEAALRSLLLGLAVGVGLRMLRVRNPQVEMTAWITVLAAAFAMPLLMQTTLLRLPREIVDLPHQFLRVDTLRGTPLAQVVHGHSTAAAIGLSSLWGGWSWLTLLSSLYGTVATVLVLRLATGLLVTWRIVREARPIRTDWTRGADVRVTARILSPVTFGRVILVPISFIGWPAAKRRAVMGHELSHIEHHDFTVQVLSQLHSALFWFSPFAWWLQVRLAALAETTSDEAAILRVGDRVSYAEILLDIASGAHGVPAGIAMARPALLRERIEHILSQAAPAVTLKPWRRLALAALLLPGAALVGGTSWQADAAAFTIPSIPAIPPIPPIPAIEPTGGGSAVYPVVIQSRGHSIIDAGGGDLKRLLQARDTAGRESILFLRDDRLYRITDHDLVSDAVDLFDRSGDYADQARDAADQAREIGEQQAELGRNQADIGRRMGDAAAQYSRTIAEQSAAAATVSSGDPDQVAADRDEAKRAFKDQMDELAQEEKELGRQQGRLGGEQAKLSAQQQHFSAEQSRVSREAGAKLVRLLNRAVAHGPAVVMN